MISFIDYDKEIMKFKDASFRKMIGRFSMKKSRNFINAPHENIAKKSDYFVWECDFLPNFQGIPHEIRFSSKFSGCYARKRDFLQIFHDIPHASTIFFKFFKIFRTEIRLSSK